MNSILQEDIRLFAETFQQPEALRGKTLMVTGATGLLGSCTMYCLQALNRRHDLGLHLVAVVRSVEKAVRLFGEESDEVSFVEWDFSEYEGHTPKGLSSLLAPRKADYILHLASPTASRFFLEHPAETLQTAWHGTETVLEYARENAVEGMVFVSSLEAYGQVYDDQTAIGEHEQGFVDPLDARSSYPMAKRAAEALCHAYAVEYGVPVCMARLAQTFGAGVSADDQRVFAQFARSAISQEDIVLHTTGELSRCYCYTTDAVSAMLLLLLKGTPGEAYNVADKTSYISVRDMAELVCREFNPSGRVVVQQKTGMGYSPVTRLRLSTERMRALGWQPHYDLREMFRRLILFLKEESL